jgi:hypothetical protein
MKKQILLTFGGLIALSNLAAAETWKNVAVVDTSCLAKVKADPDKHTVQCALQCVKGGYGLITPDGAYLKFDAAGNEKTVAALKATSKTDHVRAVVVGEREGETIKVTSVSID